MDTPTLDKTSIYLFNTNSRTNELILPSNFIKDLSITRKELKHIPSESIIRFPTIFNMGNDPEGVPYLVYLVIIYFSKLLSNDELKGLKHINYSIVKEVFHRVDIDLNVKHRIPPQYFNDSEVPQLIDKILTDLYSGSCVYGVPAMCDKKVSLKVVHWCYDNFYNNGGITNSTLIDGCYHILKYIGVNELVLKSESESEREVITIKPNLNNMSNTEINDITTDYVVFSSFHTLCNKVPNIIYKFKSLICIKSEEKNDQSIYQLLNPRTVGELMLLELVIRILNKFSFDIIKEESYKYTIKLLKTDGNTESIITSLLCNSEINSNCQSSLLRTYLSYFDKNKFIKLYKGLIINIYKELILFINNLKSIKDGKSKDQLQKERVDVSSRDDSRKNPILYRRCKVAVAVGHLSNQERIIRGKREIKGS